MSDDQTDSERQTERLGEPAFTRRGTEDCPECRAMVGTRHLDGCSGQFHEEVVGTAHPTGSVRQDGMSSPGGIQLIAAERQRQIVDEDWAPEHDAHHADGELAAAGAAYAQRPDRRSLIRLIQDPADGGWYYDNAHTRSTCGPRCPCAKRGIPDDAPRTDIPEDWPFDPSWWKPSEDRVRELVKAGALIAAEIDRLLAVGGQDPEVPRG